MNRIAVIGIVLLALYVGVPLLVGNDLYLMSLTVAALTIAGVALAWALLGNLGGMVSFGHNAFFGVGSYVSALLTLKAGWLDSSARSSRWAPVRASQHNREARRARPGWQAATAARNAARVSASMSFLLPGQAWTSGQAARRRPGRSTPARPHRGLGSGRRVGRRWRRVPRTALMAAAGGPSALRGGRPGSAARRWGWCRGRRAGGR